MLLVRARVTLALVDRRKLAADAHARAIAGSHGDCCLNLHPDLSFIAMVTHASFVVQSVMALLLVLSFWSWWQIFLKMFVLKRAVASTDVVRGRILEGRRPRRALPAREPGARRRHARADLLGGLSGVRQAPQAGIVVGGDDGQRAARDARDVPARDRHAGGQPRGPRDRRLGQPLHRPVRHRVGHHEFVSRTLECQPGDARASRARASPRR